MRHPVFFTNIFRNLLTVNLWAVIAISLVPTALGAEKPRTYDLFLPLADLTETVSYYDCRNKDGSISYRSSPCTKDQQKIRQQLTIFGENKKNSGIEMASTTPNHPEPAAQNDRKSSTVAQDVAAGENAYRSGKFEDALTLYRKAADQGSALAQFSLGVIYDIGQGVAQNYQLALFWYGKAADSGEVKALNNLGFMYSQGKGVVRDYPTAYKWFNISEARGYAEGKKNREFIEKFLSPAQLNEAQQLTNEWLKTHPLP